MRFFHSEHFFPEYRPDGELPPTPSSSTACTPGGLRWHKVPPRLCVILNYDLRGTGLPSRDVGRVRRDPDVHRCGRPVANSQLPRVGVVSTDRCNTLPGRKGEVDAGETEEEEEEEAARVHGSGVGGGVGWLETGRVVEGDRRRVGQRGDSVLSAVALRRHPPASALPLGAGADSGREGGDF